MGFGGAAPAGYASGCSASRKSRSPTRAEPTDETRAFALLAAAPVARLATLNSGGTIDLVPITFALVGRRLVTAVDHKPKTTTRLQRLANVRARPDAVTVIADHYEDDWTRLWWVRVKGRGRVVETGADHDQAIDALIAKYAQYRERRPTGPAIVVDVSEWRGWASGD